VLGQIVESAWSRNDDVRSALFVLEFLFVLLERYSSEVAAESELRFLEITA